MVDGGTKDENINTGIVQISAEFKAAVSVDCVIFGYNEDDLKVLLLRSDMPPYQGCYSLLGDLLRPDENTNASAMRIVEKHTGLIGLFMEQVCAFSDVDRHPLGRVVTIAYYSLLELDDAMVRIVSDHPNLKWESIGAIDRLAFDHKQILDKCLDTLRLGLRDRPIGFNLLPQKFTLKQLQNLYEKVLNIEVDRRNFRRKLKSLDVLVDVNENQKDVHHRPAKLYTFDENKFLKKKQKGFSFEL